MEIDIPGNLSRQNCNYLLWKPVYVLGKYYLLFALSSKDIRHGIRVSGYLVILE
jgi:hypothetical protein